MENELSIVWKCPICSRTEHLEIDVTELYCNKDGVKMEVVSRRVRIL